MPNVSPRPTLGNSLISAWRGLGAGARSFSLLAFKKKPADVPNPRHLCHFSHMITKVLSTSLISILWLKQWRGTEAARNHSAVKAVARQRECLGLQVIHRTRCPAPRASVIAALRGGRRNEHLEVEFQQHSFQQVRNISTRFICGPLRSSISGSVDDANIRELLDCRALRAVF